MRSAALTSRARRTSTAPRSVDSSGTGTISNGNGLTVTGDATFGNTVGGTYALGSLDVTGAADVNGAGIFTVGDQTFGGAVSLGSTAGTTFDSTAGSIDFVSTIDGAGATLDVTTGNPTGNVTFGDSIGATAPLGSFTVYSDNTTFAGTIIATSGGTQDYFTQLTLTNASGATLSDTSGTADISLGTVDGAVPLSISVTGGDVFFSGSIGAVTPLASISVTGAPVTFDSGLAGEAVDIVTTGSQTYNSGITLRALDTGDVVLEVTNATGTITLGASRTYDNSGNLSLLSAGGITIDASLQNSGSGAINVVAGWDGSNGLFTETPYGGQGFDFASLGAAGTAYGTTGHDVTIDGSSGGLAAIGSALGATNVAGDNVVVNGDAGGAQIGFNLGTTGTTATGAITVLAADNVTLTGGTGTGAFAQIGHGGFDAGSGNASLGDVALTGDITMTAGGNVNVLGGTGGDAYAQIGHGGDKTLSNANVTGSTTLGGSIDVSAGGNIAVAGGNSTTTENNYAQIGHGGLEFGTNTGTTNTTLGALSVTGDITVTSTGSSGTISLGGGSDEWDYAQIGHGGLSFAAEVGGGTLTLNSATLSGNISVGAAGNISLAGGTGGSSADAFDAYAQIGHGGDAALSAITVNGAMTLGGTIGVT